MSASASCQMRSFVAEKRIGKDALSDEEGWLIIGYAILYVQYLYAK